MFLHVIICTNCACYIPLPPGCLCKPIFETAAVAAVVQELASPTIISKKKIVWLISHNGNYTRQGIFSYCQVEYITYHQVVLLQVRQKANARQAMQ
jgi:hypothetical protein